MLQTWNVSKVVEEFYNQRVGESETKFGLSNTTITFGQEDEWKYFHAVMMIIGSDDEFDWYPENVGSFMINWLFETIKVQEYDDKVKAEYKVSISDIFDTAFTIPEMNISILNFAHLSTINDFRQLLVSEDTAIELNQGSHYAKVKNYLPNFPSSFYKCFRQEKSYFDQIILESKLNKGSYLLKSPCIEKRHFNTCEEYCQWNKDSKWSNFFNEEEFRSLMKYALPQAKVPDQQGNSEYEMMSKIVGKENLKKKPMVAPVPLVILCKYKEYQGLEGQDIGMNATFCDNFVEVPSDVGICISGAMNTTDIFKSDVYGSEWNVRKINGGTYSSSATFFLDTDSGERSHLISRSNDNPFDEFDEIKFQIHPVNELAQILYEPSQDHSTRSFTLKRGHEYTFEVGIDGRIIRGNFHELSIDQRKCKLSNEVEEDSWFKFYSKRQCKYKCRTLLAYDICGCIPWDIFHVGSYPECDVFGRTCFKNAMDSITHSNGLCKDCYDDCQYLRYRYKMTNAVTDTLSGYHLDKVHVTIEGLNRCSGMKDLCQYLEDKNHTLNDKYSPKRYPGELEDRREGMIVVSIVFPTAEADLTVMDVRYTLIDKITSLGGSFGLFTQFTGCSIIAVIHLIILTIKQICIFFRDLKAKFCRRD